MEEIWKDVVGYEGLYQVSNQGRVKSLGKTIQYANGRVHKYYDRILINRNMQNYLYVGLSKNKKQKLLRVHILVAKAFIPNPNKYTEINHKDENTINNNVANLEWCTHSYNINYGSRNCRVRNHFIKKVYQYSFDGDLVHIFDSLSEAAKYHNYRVGNLSVACRKVLKGTTCCGQFFSYEPLTKDQLQKAKAIKELYIKHRNRHKDYIWLYKNDMNIGELKMENQ